MWWLIPLGLVAVFLLMSVSAWFLYAPRPEKPDPEKIRIACIGDSITFGSGVLKTCKEDVWVSILGKELGDNYQVINFGISGATLQYEGDKPYRKQGFLQKVEAATPQVIVLMLGTNDSKPYNWDADRFQREYTELAAALKAYPWPHSVILMAPPKAFPQEETGEIAFHIENETIRESIRSIVQAVAEKNGIPCIDLYALTENHPEYFADGVHPNQLGNQKIAEYIYNTGYICL